MFGFLTPGQGSKDRFAGTHRGHNFWVDILGAPHDGSVSENKITLRPLIGLMNGLAPKEIEWFVIDEIEKHRRLREEATRIEMMLDSQAAGDEQAAAQRAYISAMIAVHAQQTVVSTLLDILGYIPEIPKQKPQ